MNRQDNVNGVISAVVIPLIFLTQMIIHKNWPLDPLIWVLIIGGAALMFVMGRKKSAKIRQDWERQDRLARWRGNTDQNGPSLGSLVSGIIIFLGIPIAQSIYFRHMIDRDFSATISVKLILVVGLVLMLPAAMFQLMLAYRKNDIKSLKKFLLPLKSVKVALVFLAGFGFGIILVITGIKYSIGDLIIFGFITVNASGFFVWRALATMMLRPVVER